ncbi:MAG: alpha-glucan family phosphorylase [Candidatus Doudnabacteria bacterium]|nr:alpha-glucan family phosphorylase [Candidatus Doudnabacteria bacterium]
MLGVRIMAKPYAIATSNEAFKQLAKQPIAFFSAEYAFDENPPIYAGGLGILAGDYLLEASEQGLPVVAFGLFYRRGFEIFQRSSAANNFLTAPSPLGFELLKEKEGKSLCINVELDDRTVCAQVWFKAYGTVHLFLLDTNLEENSSTDREITANLYPGDFQTRLLQEIVFGIGSVKLLRKLNITPSLYHLNEGHSGFVALALAIEYLHDHPSEKNFTKALDANKSKIMATKHTILPGSGIFFTREDFRGVFDGYLRRHKVSFDDFCLIGAWEKNPDVFSMTKFFLRSACRANAVSRAHAFFEKETHPQSALFPITNAIYLKRWRAQEWAGKNSANLSGQEIWDCRQVLRQKLLDYVNEKTGGRLRSDVLTAVWARRLVAYKRPLLLFQNPHRLVNLVRDPKRPIQFIVAGLPHAADEEGISFLKQIIAESRKPQYKGRVVYLPDYSLQSAKELARGADVWLNTPQRGNEASGTSGMKASLNGALQFSTLDGWALEVKLPDFGWVLPEENIEEEVYNIFEGQIAPLFYERDGKGLPSLWIEKMRKAIDTITRQFSTKRMLDEYFTKLYFPKT